MMHSAACSPIALQHDQCARTAVTTVSAQVAAQGRVLITPLMCFAEYNSVRLIFTVLIALFFGTAFWQMGLRRRVSLLQF